MGSEDYPRTDLNVGQNSNLFEFYFLNFVLGSNLSQVAPFPTTPNT